MPQVISLDLGGTTLKGALVDERGAMSGNAEMPVAGQDRDALVHTIIAMIRQLESGAADIVGVGLGMPGPLDPFSGTVLTTPNLPFKEPFPMKQVLEKETGLRVLVNNDANVAALGEAWQGAARGAKNVVLLTIGTGIGGGLIIDGKLYMGSNGFGGELGHITLDADGPACGCGSNGCFEALASASAIIRSAQEKIDPSIDNTKRVAELAEGGDAAAQVIWHEEGRWLGVAIASYLNIFNPEFVVLGGGVAGAWPLFQETMFAEIKRRAFAVMCEHARIVPAALGNDAGIIGAGKLVFG